MKTINQKIISLEDWYIKELDRLDNKIIKLAEKRDALNVRDATRFKRVHRELAYLQGQRFAIEKAIKQTAFLDDLRIEV
jgi:hypothetical protein